MTPDDLKARLAHRCSERDCPHFGQRTDRGCKCHRTDEQALLAHIEALEAELIWISMFADMRSKDESKVFARVNRGALRTISEKARAALSVTSKGTG